MSNNPDNIGSIYMSVRSRIASAVSRLVPPKEVEDIVQETYVRVCQVDSEAILHPRSFILRTAKNLALDHIKRAETRLVNSIHDEDGEDNWLQADLDADETYNSVAAKQEFGVFCEAVRQLPQQCRKVFVLKKVYGHSQREIAAELQISQSTVEKHIASGLRRCSAYIAQQQRTGNTVARPMSRGAVK